MSTIYRAQLALPEDNSTTVITNVQIGNEEVNFHFQWAIASEEQYNLVMNYINTKTRSDPLNVHGSFTYDYDYMEYYLNLRTLTDEELNDWLDTKPVLPNSIVNAARASQLLMLHQRITECEALEPVLAQYKEVLRWQFRATYKDAVTTGYVEPGGWYRNQDPNMCFRFISELPYIGRKDFNNVAIEFEVNDA